MATAQKSAPASPVDEAKSLIEKAGYEIAAIIRQDSTSVLFVSKPGGRAHTAWFGKNRLGKPKAFIDEGFLAEPTPYSFDDDA